MLRILAWTHTARHTDDLRIRGSTMDISHRTSTQAGIKVVSTLAFKKAMGELVARFEQLTGMAATIDFAPTNALLGRIQSGEFADAAILTAEAIDQLTDCGVVRESRADLALSAVGIAVKAGAHRPNIESVDALKSALLKAESIVYSRIGA